MKKHEEEIVNDWLKGKVISGVIKKEFPLAREPWINNPQENLDRALAKRADLVIENKNRVEIYEVKPKLNPEALGQLLVYRWLYREKVLKKPYKDKEIILRVLCRETDPEIEPFFKKLGIEVIVV